MTVKFKPGLHVVTADGSELVLIDRAPVSIYRYADNGAHVSPRAYRDVRDVARYGAPVYRHADRDVQKLRTPREGGKGQAWWAQDATTGRPLPHSIRESELSRLTDGAVMSA